MRYEPVDLGVLKAAFEKIDAMDLANWVGEESTSMYARKIWYLYELLTGKALDLPDVAPTGYVDLLNPKLQLTGATERVKRQRINDNLLGNAGYCPLVRLTDHLADAMGKGLNEEAQTIVEGVDPLILAMAISYLYTRETKSIHGRPNRRSRSRGKRPAKLALSGSSTHSSTLRSSTLAIKMPSSHCKTRSWIRVSPLMIGGRYRITWVRL